MSALSLLRLTLIAGAAVASAARSAPADIAKPKNDAPKPQHLLGDWGGLRTRLHDGGLDLTLDYRGEAGAVVAGGKRRGADYAQQVELKADADWGKIARAKGLRTHMILVNRAGRNASTDYAGDQLFQIQEIFGGTHAAIVHLVELYAQQKLDDDHIDIAAGRLPVGEDFATSPLYCAFMNTAICGYPHSLPAKVGFSVFPNSTWGARIRAAPGAHVYAQVGAYQVRPKFGGKYGFDWGFSGTTGTYFPAEVGWEPEFGAAALPGHYKAGFGYDTSNYKDNLLDAVGRPFVLSGAPPREHASRHSWYLLADQMLARNGDGPANGFVVMGGYVHSAPATSQLSDFVFLGLLDQGVIAGRPDDSAGIIVSKATISGSLHDSEALQSGLGLTLAGGAPSVQTSEIIVEGRYQVALRPGLDVMPDIQYLVRPSASRHYRNATALGLRIDADF